MTTTPTTAPATSGRLRNGQLRAQVAGVLAASRRTEFSPRQVAAELNRSAGAVGNALKALAASGAAEVTSEKPLRYRATRTTRKAATPPAEPTGSAATPAAPAPSRRTTSTAPKTTPPKATAPKTTPPKATAGKGAAPAPTPAVTGPVARPNGQMYHPRTLSGLPDVTALRKLRAAEVPVLLYGPPGTGKTAVVEAAFPDVITVAGDGDTTVADLVGEYTQTPDGRYVFVHGPLITAMREGRPLFLDDASLIPPTVLAVVYPAMDGRREVTIKANGGERVTAAPGFYVIAGHNPGVHGAVVTDALSSRFSAQIQVSSDYDLARELKVDARAVRVARNLATKQARGEVTWAPQLRELIAFDKIAAVLGAPAAAGNLLNLCPDEDRDTVAAVLRSTFGTVIAPLALGGRL
ncbi:AAA family ATPase [Saccharopolyspora cebuensis]|uniref:AAA family ATPase n=1 Tax=Saccharopolyspora cebuensis TaxID=418759 RepID=A0ABV4CNS7_9PSEU